MRGTTIILVLFTDPKSRAKSILRMLVCLPSIICYEMTSNSLSFMFEESDSSLLLNLNFILN